MISTEGLFSNLCVLGNRFLPIAFQHVANGSVNESVCLKAYRGTASNAIH